MAEENKLKTQKGNQTTESHISVSCWIGGNAGFSTAIGREADRQVSMGNLPIPHSL